MWIRYFLTFLDILFCIIFVAMLKDFEWEKDKGAIIIFVIMTLSYAGSVFLMWN